MSELRAAHHQNDRQAGLDMNLGKVGNMRELGVTEAYIVKRRVVSSAASAAEMILRIDNILTAAPRQRGGDQCM